MRRFTIRSRMWSSLCVGRTELVQHGRHLSHERTFHVPVHDVGEAVKFPAHGDEYGPPSRQGHDLQNESPLAVKAALMQWEVNLQHADQVIQELQAGMHDDGMANLQKVSSALHAYHDMVMTIVRRLDAQGYDTATIATRLSAKALLQLDEAETALNLVDLAMRRDVENDAEQQAALPHQVEQLFALTVILGLLVVVSTTFINVRSICQPIGLALQFFNPIARGDLTDHGIDTSGEDEAAGLLKYLEAMRVSLGSLVGQMHQASDSLATASAEIAAGNQDLSVRTEQTANNLQRAASSMDQLTDAVSQSVDDACQHARQLSSSAAQLAQRGGAEVSKVVCTMQEINTSSKQISEIIGVINCNAFQTNILALNAAVEAARAGDQGRGFAVVVSEARSLAMRSADAAKEIKRLIEASVDRVEVGTSLAGSAGQTMAEIVKSVQNVSAIIGEITAASTEQSQGIAVVNTSVTQLDQKTLQNAALVEQSAAACREHA